jgi:photosystem II stability/assembly factor-like uncharacterized protein
MKKIIFTFLILHFFLIAANAQWIQQYQTTLYRHFSDVKFINRYTGWTSGNQGTLLKTTNEGLNWVEQNTNTPNKVLKSIYPVNSNVIYIVGYFETILKSTNGGDNWIQIKNGPYGTGHSYEGVFFVNENTGWICGSGSLIFKTTNGGVSFDSVSIPVGYNYDIYFRNANEGLVCGEAASMYKTTNGGQNWNEIILPVGTQASDFLRLSFINNNTGYTQGVGNNKLYKTTNFGSNWDSVARVQGADISNTIFFPNEFTGWSAGSMGLMFKTTNGGYNWQPQVLPPVPTSSYSGLWFYNDSIGWVVGGNTSIHHTINGGNPTYIINSSEIINDFKLYQNYPNPFNPTTIIKFSIPACHSCGSRNPVVTLKVYDILGREIATLVNEKLKAGTYEIPFSDNKISSGVYFYKLAADEFTETKRMLLIK